MQAGTHDPRRGSSESRRSPHRAGCPWRTAPGQDPAEIASAFDRGGVDGKRLLERSGEDAIKAELAQNTASAVERGAFGIPTFFVGDEMWFGKERLAQVAEALG